MWPTLYYGKILVDREIQPILRLLDNIRMTVIYLDSNKIQEYHSHPMIQIALPVIAVRGTVIVFFL